MIPKWINACLGLALALQLLLSPAQALEIKGLYQAKVPVKSQTRAERLEVYPAALSQVTIKLTGDRSVPELPQLAGFMRSARTLVQQFHYDELPTDEALAEEGYRRQLVVRFDGNAVRQALIEAGVPLWGTTRSEVLVLLAIEDREARYLVAANTLAELETQLQQHSARRGLPMILPLMDLEDQMNLGFVDVWGDFRHNVMQASERYGTDAALVGRLIRTPEGMWQARWSLHQQDNNLGSEFWYVEANTQQEVLAAGVDGTADRISQRYAQVFSVGSTDSVMVKVTDVHDLAGYARAMKYLESLDIVTSVEVDKVVADQVLFRLAIRGDMTGLEQAVSLGNTLMPAQGVVVNQGDELAVGRAFVYQLLP